MPLNFAMPRRKAPKKRKKGHRDTMHAARGTWSRRTDCAGGNGPWSDWQDPRNAEPERALGYNPGGRVTREALNKRFGPEARWQLSRDAWLPLTSRRAWRKAGKARPASSPCTCSATASKTPAKKLRSWHQKKTIASAIQKKSAASWPTLRRGIGVTKAMPHVHKS